MTEGYIKLYRSLTRWEWYHDAPTRALFVHLLLTVNFEEVQWRGIAIGRGERVTSQQKLAEELNLSVKQVRTALSHLKRTGEVAYETNRQWSLFRVVRYDEYQSGADERAKAGQTGGEAGAKEGQQYKKEKNNNKNNNRLSRNFGEKKTAPKKGTAGISGRFDYREFERRSEEYIRSKGKGTG